MIEKLNFSMSESEEDETDSKTVAGRPRPPQREHLSYPAGDNNSIVVVLLLKPIVYVPCVFQICRYVVTDLDTPLEYT